MKKHWRKSGWVVATIAYMLLGMTTGCAGTPDYGKPTSAVPGTSEHMTQGATDANVEVTTAQEATKEVPLISRTYTDPDNQVTLFEDPREPHYEETTKQIESVPFRWSSKDGQYEFSITVPVDLGAYRYYTALPRYQGVINYEYYLKDPSSEKILAHLVDSFTQIQQQTGYHESQMLVELVHFVQQCFAYEEDEARYGIPDYPKYPLETIYEKCGDCEDTSFLAACLMRDLGYEVALIVTDTHCAVGVKGRVGQKGAYYVENGIRYYYAEMTNTGYEIGDVPENIDTSKANLLVLEPQKSLDENAGNVRR